MPFKNFSIKLFWRDIEEKCFTEIPGFCYLLSKRVARKFFKSTIRVPLFKVVQKTSMQDQSEASIKQNNGSVYSYGLLLIYFNSPI